MSFGTEGARQVLVEARRWSIDEWDLRDTDSELYWREREGAPVQSYSGAVEAIRRAADQDLPGAVEARDMLERIDDEVRALARRILEWQSEFRPDDAYVDKWSARAQLAIQFRLVAELARPWIAGDEVDRLAAGYRAAEDKLNYEFTLRTYDQHQWDAAARFGEGLRTLHPGTTTTFDPSGRPDAAFRVLGQTYRGGQEDLVKEALYRELEGFLRKCDPDGRIEWPPADFRATRGRPGWVR